MGESFEYPIFIQVENKWMAQVGPSDFIALGKNDPAHLRPYERLAVAALTNPETWKQMTVSEDFPGALQFIIEPETGWEAWGFSITGPGGERIFDLFYKCPTCL